MGVLLLGDFQTGIQVPRWHSGPSSRAWNSGFLGNGNDSGTGMTYRPPQNAPDVQIGEIPDGENGTKATILKMRDAALGTPDRNEGAHNKDVRFLAQKIVSDVPSKDYVGEVREIFNFMRQNVRYTLDPRGLEYVQTPWFTLLVIGQGDCDDHATAAMGLGVSLGHGAAVRTVKADKGRPNDWSHIYAVIGVRQNGKVLWLPIDSTEKNAVFGQDPPGAERMPMRTWVLVPA